MIVPYRAKCLPPCLNFSNNTTFYQDSVKVYYVSSAQLITKTLCTSYKVY